MDTSAAKAVSLPLIWEAAQADQIQYLSRTEGCKCHQGFFKTTGVLSQSKGTHLEGLQGIRRLLTPLERSEWEIFLQAPGDGFRPSPEAQGHPVPARPQDCSQVSSSGSVHRAAIQSPRSKRWAYNIRKGRDVVATPNQTWAEEPEHPSQFFQQSEAEPFSLAQQGEEVPTFLTQERGVASPEDEPSWNTVPFRLSRSGQVQNVTVSGPPVTGAKYFPLDLQWNQEDGNSKLDGTSQSSSAPWQGKSRRPRPTRRKQKNESLGRRGGKAERQECPQLEEELPQVWRSFDSLCDAIQQQDSISATERIVLDLEGLLQDQEEDFPFLKRLVDSFLNALTDQLYFMDLPMISKVALYYGSQLKTNGGTTLKVTTANVTSWRKQVLDWHSASKGEILLVQETHLHGDDLMAFGIQAYKAGYHHFGGEGSPPNPRPKGGVAILVPAQMHGREVEHFSIQGCGFVAVELPRIRWNLLVVSLYLKVDSGLQSYPNVEILSQLACLLRSHRNFIVAGDWNVQIEELAGTSLPEVLSAELLTDGQATVVSGSTLDFGLASMSIAAHTRTATDWAVPFGTHAAVHFEIDISQGQVPVPQIRGSLREKPMEVVTTPGALGDMAGVELPDNPITREFADFVAAAELASYGSVQGRGAQNPMVLRPSMQVSVNQQWFGAPACTWNKMRAQVQQSAQVRPEWLAFGLAHWTGDSDPQQWTIAVNNGDLNRILELCQEQREEADSQAKTALSHSYKEWLEGSSAGGLKPLFKALKKEETVTARPFRTLDYASRMHARLEQWVPLWQAQGQPLQQDDTLMEEAREQARQLPPIKASWLMKYFKQMPVKAPGVDGVEVPFLKTFTREQCQQLADIIRKVELEGAAPAQWLIAIITLLPKNQDIERPIALIPIPQKISIKCRWNLAEEWLDKNLPRLWWDSAVPGTSTLDVSLRRLMSYEAGRCKGDHFVTIFIDLTTFYESVSIDELKRSAKALAFPALLLHNALRSYQGARIILSEQTISPPLFARRGLLAGCPLAPMLSKLALFGPCSQALEGNVMVDNADIWIDDISIDTRSTIPHRVANQAKAIYRKLESALGAGGHSISVKKTYFLASSKEAEKALKAILSEDEPQVRSVGVDLGMANSGARRRSMVAASKRQRKAGARLRKLQKLRVPRQKIRTRLFQASIFTSGLWGHQSQGVSPKVRKDVRSKAAHIGGKPALGSVDITLDIGDDGVKDPGVAIIVQHWVSLAKIIQAADARDWIERTWALLWQQHKDKHAWKRVSGPIAAMVCYLKELGVQAPALNTWTIPSGEGRQAGEVSLHWGEPWTPFQIKGLLMSLAAQRRAASISKLTDCQELAQGCDWTIHRKLLKQFKGKKKERFLKSVWQGAFYAATSKGHFICSKCGVKAGQSHALVECQWWDEIGESLPIWWRKEKETSPALWNRAICPARDTTHPTYTWGDDSVHYHGIFEEVQFQGGHLVFATDASGGRYSSDRRLRITTWAVVAFTPEHEGLKELGYMTGVCEPGTSVPTAEAEALNRCLARVQGHLDVTIDCAPAIRQLESKSFKEKHWPAWTQWAEKGRLKPFWVRSQAIFPGGVRC